MPQEDKQLYVKIHSPFEVFFEGKAFSISAVNKLGPFDILPGHANFITILESEPIKLHTKQEERFISIDGGIMWVYGGNVKVFANL